MYVKWSLSPKSLDVSINVEIPQNVCFLACLERVQWPEYSYWSIVKYFYQAGPKKNHSITPPFSTGGNNFQSQVLKRGNQKTGAC